MGVPSAEIREFVEVVGPRIGQLIDRIVVRTKTTLPAYVDVDAEDVRTGIARDLQLAITALMEDRPLTDADRAGLGMIGNDRATRGIPLEQMLQVYRFTVDEIFQELWAASEDGLIEHEKTVSLTRQIWRYADPMIDLAIQAYRAKELEQAVADTQGRTALVHRLLMSTPGAAPIDPVLGAHLDPTATYVAIRARPDDGDLRQLLLELQQPGVLEGAAVAPYEGDVIGYARRRPSLVPPDGVVIGVGPAVSLAGLPHSFAIATRVAETAQAFGIDGVRSIDQLALQAIARTEDVLGEHLIARFVTPCEPSTPAGEELLDTIRAVLRHDLSVDQAAAAMWVHPNTVRNRVRRFEQLTASSLRSVDDLVAMRLALLRAELH